MGWFPAPREQLGSVLPAFLLAVALAARLTLEPASVPVMSALWTHGLSSLYTAGFSLLIFYLKDTETELGMSFDLRIFFLFGALLSAFFS